MASSRTRIAWGLALGLALLIAIPAVQMVRGALAAIAEADARIDSDLARRRVPSAGRVYGRSLRLVEGLRPGRVRLDEALERVGYRRAAGAEPAIGQYAVAEKTFSIGVRAFAFPGAVEPARVVVLELDERGRTRRIRGPEGEALEQVRIEPPILGFLSGDRGQDRIPVRLEDMPEHVVNAFLAIEDHRFYEHSGIDVRRVLGAVVANLRAGRIVQGGSTITQQLARSLFLTRRRVLSRKLEEAAIAIALERRFSKDEILELYLNEIYLGQHGALAVHGVGAAARHYFGAAVADVDVHQSAMLAALARGPSRYAPTRTPEATRARRDLVLARMRELGMLDAETAELALAHPLDLSGTPSAPRSARYFVDYVRADLAEKYDEETLETSGLRLFTSLDWRLQEIAERSVGEGLLELEERAKRLLARETPVQAALVALDPHTGDLLALVGGRDYATTQFNRAIDAKRQPGSVFKTVVALAALAPPDPPFTLASVLVDEPLLIPAPEPLPGEELEEDWEPKNHDEEFRGEVTVRQAVEESLNIPMVRLGQEVGLRRTIQTARKLGIRSRLRPVPSLALGTFEVSLLEMTRAYGVLAAGGRRADVRSVHYVTSGAGTLLEEVPSELSFAFDSKGVYLVTSALEGAVERGTGKSVRAHGFYTPLAGKTGTSDDYRDGWFIGYTPQIAVGVWVGFDDEQSLGLPGAFTALPIFTEFMKQAVGARGGPRFHPPRGVERVEVVSHPAFRSGLRCNGSEEWFLASYGPTEDCNAWWLPNVGAGPRGFPWPFRMLRPAARETEATRRP